MLLSTDFVEKKVLFLLGHTLLVPCSLNRHAEAEPALVHLDQAPHLLSGAHGGLLQGLGGLVLALPSVEGAEVLQGRRHCGAARRHIPGFHVETDAACGFSLPKCERAEMC